jgi:hypothetical protein
MRTRYHFPLEKGMLEGKEKVGEGKKGKEEKVGEGIEPWQQ